MAERRPIVFLHCQLATGVMGLPIEHVIETMRPLSVEVVPDAPPYMAGLSLIRGELVLVVDVGRLLGDAGGHAGRFVTVRAGTRTIALAVGGVAGIRTVGPDGLHSLPLLLRDAGAETIAAIGTLDAALLAVLRSARLLPEILPLADPGALAS